MTSKVFFRRWGWTLLLVVLGAGIAGYTFYRHSHYWEKQHILVVLKPIQTPKGWGYDILTDGKIFIHQNIIPAIGGDRGFRTKEDALAVGQKVYDRLMKGEVPMVTAEEVRNMGIVPAEASGAPQGSAKQ